MMNRQAANAASRCAAVTPTHDRKFADPQFADPMYAAGVENVEACPRLFEDARRLRSASGP